MLVIEGRSIDEVGVMKKPHLSLDMVGPLPSSANARDRIGVNDPLHQLY